MNSNGAGRSPPYRTCNIRLSDCERAMTSDTMVRPQSKTGLTLRGMRHGAMR